MAKYNKHNEEIPDNTPVEIPLGYNAPEPLQDLIKRIVRGESEMAGRNGQETFEEADDFDTGDEIDNTLSHYQVNQMEEEKAEHLFHEITEETTQRPTVDVPIKHAEKQTQPTPDLTPAK